MREIDYMRDINMINIYHGHSKIKPPLEKIRKVIREQYICEHLVTRVWNFLL